MMDPSLPSIVVHCSPPSIQLQDSLNPLIPSSRMGEISTNTLLLLFPLPLQEEIHHRAKLWKLLQKLSKQSYFGRIVTPLSAH